MGAMENKIYAPVLWPYRLLGNMILVGFIWLLTFGVITIRHNLVSKHIDSLLTEIYNKTATAGWGLDDVTLEGREKTSKDDVLHVIGLKRGDNILEIDLKAVCEKVKTLPWVKEASVSRRYFPNVIHISIREKKVKSIWQYQNEFYPIDEDGKIIETEYVLQKNILQIVGQGAPEHINSLLNIIENDKELFSRVKVANFISGRRWNLIFDDVLNGITVKLPEEDVADAWKKLVKLDKTRGILKRKLTFIDLRLKNKVIVKISNKNANM
ncbi:MAG: FtsQ-type POTRA domain-containing protein [Alphaproteobacteria bacterium]|nr:FtsQ-type POTRA domain-containing protein [Alphaproteobacteria bacterium]